MLLAIVYEAVEASVCLTLSAKFEECKSLIEYLIRFCIVVVHGSSRFGRTLSCLFPVADSSLMVALHVESNSEQV